MTVALVLCGWIAAVLAGSWALRLRARMAGVADAAHELRGAATALGLAAAAMRREPGGLRRAHALESELHRLGGGLADLDAARTGGKAAWELSALPLERAVRLAAAGWRPSAARAGRRVSLNWEAGPVVVRADRRRVAQVLGNLLANAVEHGTGTVSLRGLRRGATVVLEVVDEGPAERQPPPAGSGGRGRGLGIAARAVEEAGGRLEVVGGPEGTTASVELPAVGP